MKNKKRMLLFSYFFPPLGGPGVQRPCKMVHYLRKKDWDIDVISVNEIEFHSFDNTLCEECDENNLYRVNSLDPMRLLYLVKKYLGKSKKKRNSKTKSPKKKFYFYTPEWIKKIIRGIFPIDDKIGWLPFAYRAGDKLCKENKYDAVMATIGPYTSALIAYKIAKRFDVPLLIDYRDLWTQHPYLKYISRLHQKYSEFWEKRILKKARVVTTASKSMKHDLCKKFGVTLEEKFLVMYNAWDEKDFVNFNPRAHYANMREDQITFTYLGGFYGKQTPKYFIRAMAELYKQARLPEEVRFVFVGNYFSDVKMLLENNSINDLIKIIPQVPHEKAIEYLMSADALLLFVSSSKSKGVITGKIFEYIRSEKKILAMIPPKGEAAEILKSTQQDHICAMENVKMIKQNFLRSYADLKKGGNTNRPLIDQKFSRENQTNRFDAFLRKKIKF